MKFFKKRNDYDDYYDEDGYFVDNPTTSRTEEKVLETDIEENNHDFKNNNKYEDYSGTSLEVNIKMITVIFIYVLFLILGIANTTFDGHKPQIINAQIRSQRSLYKNVMKDIQFLENLQGDFVKMEVENRQLQERIPPLQTMLKSVNKKVDSLTEKSYKVKQNDYLKAEMLYIIDDLLKTKAEEIQLTIMFYQQSIAQVNSDEVLLLKNQLINKNNEYEAKTIKYYERLNQIKENDLYLFD